MQFQFWQHCFSFCRFASHSRLTRSRYSRHHLLVDFMVFCIVDYQAIFLFSNSFIFMLILFVFCIITIIFQSFLWATMFRPYFRRSELFSGLLGMSLSPLINFFGYFICVFQVPWMALLYLPFCIFFFIYAITLLPLIGLRGHIQKKSISGV